jgi:hypothetical protein
METKQTAMLNGLHHHADSHAGTELLLAIRLPEATFVAGQAA